MPFCDIFYFNFEIAPLPAFLICFGNMKQGAPTFSILITSMAAAFISLLSLRYYQCCRWG
ncbi:hypothetical protein HMPREF0648_1173 [Prevotella bivia JCVIHMP010]|nr:hypothetical protein HMPREF0648_1173 [Prevotella bivia JCVIHMP010]